MLEHGVNTCNIYCLLPGRKEKELGQRGSREGGEEIFPLPSCLKEMGREEQKFTLVSNMNLLPHGLLLFFKRASGRVDHCGQDLHWVLK